MQFSPIYDALAMEHMITSEYDRPLVPELGKTDRARAIEVCSKK